MTQWTLNNSFKSTISLLAKQVSLYYYNFRDYYSLIVPPQRVRGARLRARARLVSCTVGIKT